MNYGFVIDNRLCIGCHACTVACKSEHDIPIGVNRTHVKYIEKANFRNPKENFRYTDVIIVQMHPVSKFALPLHYIQGSMVL